MYKAIFLDRDGTIIRDKGYIRKIKDVDFYPLTFQALLKAQEFFKLFIISNQQGVSLGKISLNELNEVNNYILDILAKKGIKIEKVYYCPHSKKEGCQCRKPKTYFLELASKEFSIDLTQSYVIGDHPSDIKLALNANCKSIYVLTGHGRRHLSEITGEVIKKTNLKKAIEFIINQI